MSATNIPCPLCQTPIPFDTQALLTGQKFYCPNPECNASVGIGDESANTVKSALDKLGEVKKRGFE